MMEKTKKTSQKKTIEEALKQSEEKYRILLDMAADAFFQGDKSGNFIMVNYKSSELTGYSKEELLKMNMRDLFPSDLLEANPLNYDLLSGGITIKTEREILHKDGRHILVEMHSKAMPDGTYQSLIRDITDSRNAELSALDTELKYRSLHMSMMEGYVFLDMSGKIIDSNATYQRMVGYNATELASLPSGALTPARWQELEQKIIQEQLLPKGHSSVYQIEYVKKDGTVFPVELRTFMVRNTTGINEGMWSIVRDITDRKQAEESLRKSEEKFRNIVECSPTAMHFYRLLPDNRLIFTGANPASDAIIRVSHKRLLGKTLEEAFPKLANTDIPQLLRKVAKNELIRQSFEIGYSDDRFSGFFSVHVFKTGPDEIAVEFIDITNRNRMEEALRRSEIEYRDTLDSLPDWIYVVDEQFTIAMVNAALKDELIRHGLKPDCIGMEITPEFPFISSTTIDDIKQVFNTGIVSASEQQTVLKSKTLHTEITRVPILKDGKVVKVIMMIRDRSKEYENEELKRRNAEQKEVLLREIHHRVKNNLAIVISLLNFQLRNNTNEELTHMIIDIQMRIRSMALIHEHLYRSENLDRIPLASYVESLANMVLTAFSGHHVSLIKQLEPIDASIETALPIGLIINELLTNALKYAFPVGAPGEVHITLEKGEDQMCSLVVEDNGVGLPASSSMDSEKSLGLYIVRLLVEQLDGNVQIVRDNGTSFQIGFQNLITKRQDNFPSEN